MSEWLRWNDFTENVIASVASLRKDVNFADVTLVCDDGQRFEAHQLILAAASDFFQSLLMSNNHSQPMIYMREVVFEDLASILDFLYFGEANVCKDNLDSFLSVAEQLKISGLMGNHGVQVPKKERKWLALREYPKHKISIKIMKKENLLSAAVNVEDKTITLQNDLSGHLQELDEKVKSMMEKSSKIITFGKAKHQTRADRCKLCGKEGQAVNIRDHIESNHLEGIFLPCSLCEQTFRSRHKLRCHIRVCQAD